MSIKKYLLAVAVILIATFAIVDWHTFQQGGAVIREIPAFWWGIIGLAIILQLCGHVLRTMRTKLVIDQVKEGGLWNQFGALSVGYLFSALLPLRLGEIIRALLISFRLRISFLYTFTAIVLERVIDLLLVGIIAISVATLVSGQIVVALLVGALGAIAFSTFVLIMIVLLTQQNKPLLNLIWRMTNWLSDTLRNKMRFKVWSLIYGLQQFLSQRKLVQRYIFFTLVSWVFYIASTVVIVVPLLHQSASQTFIAAAAPYIAAGTPSNVLQSAGSSKILAPLFVQIDANFGYQVLLFLVLTLPMAAIGLVALFITKNKITKRGKSTSHEVFVNKLLRHEDISQEFPAFLDSYFSGNSLALILHKLETAGQLRLVKFFKGGSDAITILVLSNEKLFVKKIIPLEYEDRLKAQYRWLKDHAKLKYLVRVLGQQKTKDYYAIDLEYDPENIPFFEYVHHTSTNDATKILDQTWNALYTHLHKGATKAVVNTKARDNFIKKHIFGCIEKAMESNADLRGIVTKSKVIINGKKYDNLYQIMDKIKRHPQAWKDIATFAESKAVHGDIAIDNIMVSSRTNTPLIIDPAPDGNIINGPVFDLGKLSQSFYCGYEFLFRDDEPIILQNGNTIRYRNQISDAYTKLWHHVHDDIAPKYLTEAEQRSLLFHAAALHIRVLKHRVYINPNNVLKFYAVGVKTLNEFLDQYNEN